MAGSTELCSSRHLAVRHWFVRQPQDRTPDLNECGAAAVAPAWHQCSLFYLFSPLVAVVYAKKKRKGLQVICFFKYFVYGARPGSAL